ncbi:MULTISPECIES: RIP metalloprotease RseP [unclassified Siphonobacter]|uniref:RIP metalloprotease RseP n=1 Tax=unclassified Siphonobacter TaxID=2635712 RepID=UPI00278B5B1C|nr:MULTISPECIES: RIP metalloprotease RseP [unclassified Siphonobacter]MDQ1087956.1 regulator of sigma E protease [Siphonobacter sp. SORGH_AS_1065]MDR6194105.1 regulator of sigma E protease [Siphonobacter sp. SORGH_AS_0500]
MSGWIMAGQLLLGLSILVGLHEFGHFFFAKLFKIRVNKFYIFFDFLFPLPNVGNFALWKKKIGDTEYGIGWFPLGGYVQIEGMVDETQDATQLSSEPKPWEFRAKPAWQRLLVMLGGIIVNIITGIIIFSALSYQNGYNYIPVSEVNKNGIVAGELAREIGLRTGDKILKVNGQPVKDFRQDVVGQVLLESNSTYTIDRNGQELTIPVRNDLAGLLARDNNPERFLSTFATLDDVARVAEPEKPGLFARILGKKEQSFPAFEAGFKEGDKILSINGTPIKYYHEFSDALAANKGKVVDVVVNRKGKTQTLKPKVTPEGKLLLYLNRTPLQKPAHEDYNFGQSVAAGTYDAFDVVAKNVKGFGKIFKGEVAASDAISGPVGISKLYGEIWDWNHFWTVTGLLSMALAFMNALPIPALDGGHVIFLLYEMIFRRAPSEKFLERAQQIGTILLLGLMVFAVGNDLFK